MVGKLKTPPSKTVVSHRPGRFLAPQRSTEKLMGHSPFTGKSECVIMIGVATKRRLGRTEFLS